MQVTFLYHASTKTVQYCDTYSKITQHRHSPYLGIPFKFTKLATDQTAPRWQRICGAPVAKIDPFGKCVASSMPSVKPCENEKSIVPFGSDARDVPEMLRFFQDLSKKRTTAIICCDFAQCNALNVCSTNGVVTFKGSYPMKTECQPMLDQCIYTGISSREQYMCLDIIPRDQHIGQDIVTPDQLVYRFDVVRREQRIFPRMIPADLGEKLVLPYQEAVENDDEEIFEDCSDSSSKIFSLCKNESLYSKFYATKKKIEDLLRSLLLMHLLVGKKLQSWKDTAISNITQLSTENITPVHTSPYCGAKKSSVPVTEMKRKHTHVDHVTGKQLRRQNRMTMRSKAVNSNRQRGMKNGRFQNNVGHRESWH